MDFARTLGVLIEFFEREDVRYAAVGAVALHAYGLTRATLDLDLATERRAQERVVQFLESLGYETLHRSAGYSNHAHALADLGRVDLIYVDGDTARLLLAPGGRMLTLGGRRVPVPRAEHLVAMKVHAMANDPTRTLREMADIQHLMGLPDADLDEIRGYFERAGLGERYREIRRLS